MINSKTLKTIVLATVAGLLPQMALAVDGVQEINQTCATQLGCFPGDSAGFPVDISGSAGKSYRLTSDLLVTEGDSGISVMSPNISIDLNGFAIIGPGCIEATMDCTPQDPLVFGDGITSASQFYGTTVKNGSIVGMFRGLFLGKQATVEDVEVRWNRSSGIRVSSDSRLTGNVAIDNGVHGISTTNGTHISNNIASNNGQKGIDTEKDSHIFQNSAYENGTDGISTLNGSSIFQNIVRGNDGSGIVTGSGSTVANNTVYVNTQHGINVEGSGTIVQNNAIRANGQVGLRITGTGTYSGNSIMTVSGSTVSGGTQGANNFCGNNFTCP